jgi:hypothetical protein
MTVWDKNSMEQAACERRVDAQIRGVIKVAGHPNQVISYDDGGVFTRYAAYHAIQSR